MSKNAISLYLCPSTVDGRHILLGKIGVGWGITALTRDEYENNTDFITGDKKSRHKFQSR
jgi:hypothetical protein